LHIVYTFNINIVFIINAQKTKLPFSRKVCINIPALPQKALKCLLQFVSDHFIVKVLSKEIKLLVEGALINSASPIDSLLTPLLPVHVPSNPRGGE
jgi:hypothetical protein